MIAFNNVVPGTNAKNIAPNKMRIIIHIFGFSFFFPIKKPRTAANNNGTAIMTNPNQ